MGEVTEIEIQARELISAEEERECVHFLVDEAELLDDNRVREWLALLTPDIDYRVPVRVTRERTAGKGFSDANFHMKDDYGTLKARVDRLHTEYAWAEDPPSRLRRFVTNFRVRRGQADGEYAVKTSILVYRGRLDAAAHDLICADRHDVLRRGADGLMLARRLVLLDHTTLATSNLAFFL